MRVMPGYTLVLLLALLLIGTTPTGTGAGVHQFDLVHPLFSHVHVVNGRVLTHEQMRRGDPAGPSTSAGPAVGAANGSNAADVDLGVNSSDRPIESLVGALSWAARRTAWHEGLPLDRREAPPDPPPTSSASRT
jgi:hypothetical protein